MKWSDRRGNWVFPSLSYNLQKLIGYSLKICWFQKKCPSLFLYHREPSIPLDALVINIVTRILVIKFRPKKRCQTVGLMKWSDHNSNWVSSSLSYNLQKLIASFFGNLLISTEVSLKESGTWHSGNSSDCQMALPTDHFVDGTFRRSNWSPNEQLVKLF